MTDPEDLISQLTEYTAFLAELDSVSQADLLSPMGAGKWSAQESIAHLMAWDANFLQTVILPLEAGGHPYIADEEDYQAFNERAAALGRQLTKQELIDSATGARRQLIEHLKRLPAEAFRTKQQGGRIDKDLTESLQRNFVSHDRSHIKQIKEHLEARRT
jgi:hypothetical protein